MEAPNSFSLHARSFPGPGTRQDVPASSSARLFLGKAEASARLIGAFVGFSPFAICFVLASSGVKFNKSHDVATSPERHICGLRTVFFAEVMPINSVEAVPRYSLNIIGMSTTTCRHSGHLEMF